MLDLPQHVLRFWETNFKQIKPVKMNGGRRYYKPSDIELIKLVRTMLYDQGYTIKGAQKALKEKKAKETPIDKDENIQLGLSFNNVVTDQKEHLKKALKELLECKRVLDRARQQ